MNPTQTISHYQPLLHSIAMKMVKSMADAEDIVQDTFLKWLSTDKKKINNTKSYLVKAVTNNCINHINSFQRKKNELMDSFQASNIIEKFKESELSKFDLDTEVEAALNVIHKKLEPLEKSIYILREVFNLEYDHLQELFDKKKEHCRQLFCRAKEKINEESRKLKQVEVKAPQFFESFKKASNFGQISQFVQLLKGELC